MDQSRNGRTRQSFLRLRLALLGIPRLSPVPGLMFVLVMLNGTGKDRFFVVPWDNLRDILVTEYSEYLKKHDGIRPKNPKRKHCSLKPTSLRSFENRWELLLES